MYFRNDIYESFLMDEPSFDGTWQEFVSAYVSIITTEAFKDNWIPSSAAEVTRQYSWLELSIRERIAKLPRGKFIGQNLIYAAKGIRDNLLKYREYSFEHSALPTENIKARNEYWYKPANPHFESRPVIVIQVSDSSIQFHESEPIRTRINRRGRKVVEHDPSTIRSYALRSEIYDITFDPRKRKQEQMRISVSDQPALCQLNAGFYGPVSGSDLSYLELPKDLSTLQMDFIAGHVRGWEKSGASQQEIMFLSAWLSNNLLLLRHEYFGASEYAPSPLFSQSPE